MSSTTNARAGAFPSTHWSRLLSLGGGRESRRRAWDSLASSYWRPVFAYVRARWARTQEEALECTQEFFLHLLEGDVLERADPAKGRFRAFVKVSLANFVRDLERKRRTLKRGGARTFLSLGLSPGEPALELPDPAAFGPEEALDRVWRHELIERATSALETELESQGKSRAFRVFRSYFLSEVDLDYATLAERHGIKSSDVSNDLQLAKRRFRSVLRAVVADTVADTEELEAELRWLFGRESEG